jgi:hypothetical protein
MMKRMILLLALALVPLLAPAQGRGVLNGGIESNSVLSVDGKFRSNDYLKLDYLNGRFSAGIQAECYLPEPLLGYDLGLKGIGLPWKYVAWTDRLWSVTAGDFYEQFGTGVILRSWEDRNLGWNNSIGGGRVTFQTPGNVFSLKLLGGFKRKNLWYGQDKVAGAEAGLLLGNFTLQGSTVLRHNGDAPAWAWSALTAYSNGIFSARAEYVGKQGGNAETLELGFAAKSFSSNLTLRRLSHMLDPMGLNYLPALCQEQSYMLACLNPYTTFADGELGGSADVFYKLGSWHFHLNGSMIYALPSALKNHDVLRLCYRDLNIHVEKRWNRRFKTVAFVSIQECSPTHGERKATNAQNAFVLDGVYKFGKLSLRAQAQYLYSEELTRDWMAGSLELSSTKGWSVHVQDMYNHGDTKENYYEAGVGYTRGGFKVDLSYGHQRAGLVCSGGVCRWQPEYTGGMLRLAYHF